MNAHAPQTFVEELLSRRRERPVEVFPAPERVEITAGLSCLYAARLDGRIWRQSDDLTLVTRVASALRVLVEHDAEIPERIA